MQRITELFSRFLLLKEINFSSSPHTPTSILACTDELYVQLRPPKSIGTDVTIYGISTWCFRPSQLQRQLTLQIRSIPVLELMQILCMAHVP